MEAELAAVRRQLGKDSSNSSTPPSKDSLAAKAKQRADRSSRERSKDRKPGGQPGRKGAGLTPTPDPDRTERVEPPVQCRDWAHKKASMMAGHRVCLALCRRAVVKCRGQSFWEFGNVAGPGAG